MSNSDLIVDAIYEGGRSGNAGDDPLGPLLGVSNQGGFRHLGKRERPHLLVVTTSMAEADWPDALDIETGLFTYYGDNRHPGRELHDTPRWGNQMLRDLFARGHGDPIERKAVPPVLVFRAVAPYRDVQFVGLAVPGAVGIPPTQDLVAIWRHSESERFQNYRSTFTILDAPILTRQWIDDIRGGCPVSDNAPSPWLNWIRGRQPNALRSTPTTTFRSRDQQLPTESVGFNILAAIHAHFSSRPHDFELCAARIAEMLLPSISSLEVTRRSRDGGRDAIGKYKIGSEAASVEVDFAIEAKCYAVDSSVGVKETSRLISRLRHRQFGILITTSFVNLQAYKEVREDGHPIIILSGRDIVSILKISGLRDEEAVSRWLSKEFPICS